MAKDLREQEAKTGDKDESQADSAASIATTSAAVARSAATNAKRLYELVGDMREKEAKRGAAVEVVKEAIDEIERGKRGGAVEFLKDVISEIERAPQRRRVE